MPYSTICPWCKHGDAVGVAHGGDAVRDEDGGASLHHFAQAVEDLILGVGIDAGQGVVEDRECAARE